MELDIYSYDDPVEFLNAQLRLKQKINPRFSLRAWAKSLGLPTPATLSLVLNRKRPLRPQIAAKLSRSLVQGGYINDSQRRYFELLVLFHNSRSSEEKELFRQILSELKPSGEFSTLDFDRLRMISEWHHIALLEMCNLKNFRDDPIWISKQFCGRLSPAEVEQSLARLLRLGLLQKDASKRLTKTSARLQTPTDIREEALQTLHSDLIQRALQALTAQSVAERDITGHTLTIRKSDIPKAKALIREFRHELADLVESKDGDAVYQLNIQFFDLLKEK